VGLLASSVLHALIFFALKPFSRSFKQKTQEPVLLEFAEATKEQNALAPSTTESLEGLASQKKSPKQASSEKNAGAAGKTKGRTSPPRNALDFSLHSNEGLKARAPTLSDETNPSSTMANANSSNTNSSGLPDSRRERPAPGADPMLSIESAGQGWSASTQYANAMDVVFTSETLSFFQALHRKVDGALVYPDDFARQRIKGLIRVDAEITRDGRLVRFLSNKADDDVLNAYVLTLLLHVLEKPLPERSWLKSERAIVSFDFDFRIRIEGSPHFELRSGAEKNRLAFGREASVDPWLNEKLKEVFTHYVPPIIPIPGGFYIDLVLAYQYVKNLAEGAPTESQARQARIEKLHEQLKATIRSRKPVGG
jgi:hypothetical protein